MKKSLLILAIALFIIGCKKEKHKTDEEGFLKKSYRVLKKEGTISEDMDEFDSINKIYSNYKYNIAFDAPNNWIIDNGNSKYTLLRGNDPELSLTFSMVVAEINSDELKNNKDWEFFIGNRLEQNEQIKKLIEKQLNTEIKNYNTSKSYVRNFISLKETYDFLSKSTDSEYMNHIINHQVYKDDVVYTFTAQMPKVVYDEKPEYFERLFNLVSFLTNLEKIGE